MTSTRWLRSAGGRSCWTRLRRSRTRRAKPPSSCDGSPRELVCALTGTPIENGLGDLWSILDFTNPGLVGSQPTFIAQLSGDGETALRALNGILLFRRTKNEPEVAAELPDKIDELDHCTMTAEQIGLYQAVLDELVADVADPDIPGDRKKGAILAAITALKQICNHPAAYRDDEQPLAGRSGKLARLEEIVEAVFAADERILVFTHFATWGRRLAAHLSAVTDTSIASYDGGLTRGTPRPTRQRVPAGPGPRGARAVAESRGHRTQPDRRQPRRVVRPMVEPRRRGPSSATAPGASGSTARSSRTGSCAPARSTNVSRKSSPASATSPSSSSPAPARSPTSTPTSSVSRSGSDPTNCSPTTTNDAPTHTSPQHRASRPQRPRPAEIWRTAAPLPDVAPITVPEEVGALLRSLGDPPMIAGSVSHYFTAVLERAAAVAAALALSADLLPNPPTSKPSSRTGDDDRDEQAPFHLNRSGRLVESSRPALSRSSCAADRSASRCWIVAS